MYCVIQQVERKKPNPYGGYREIRPYQNQWRLDDRPFTWAWEYTGGRFERTHMEAYKISIHHSYRENGKVKKHQYAIATIGYYDIAEFSLYDCADSHIKAAANLLGMDPAELYEMIYSKLEPLQDRITAEFQQSEEYITCLEHRRILEEHNKACAAFCKKYGVEKDDFSRCYDVFGTLRNKEYLKQIQAECKARKQAKRDAKRRYQEQWRSTYERYTSGSYSVPSGSTYSESETLILKQFYRSLSKLYHPDLNPDKDTTAEMQMLNRLKEQWGV